MSCKLLPFYLFLFPDEGGYVRWNDVFIMCISTLSIAEILLRWIKYSYTIVLLRRVSTRILQKDIHICQPCTTNRMNSGITKISSSCQSKYCWQCHDTVYQTRQQKEGLVHGESVSLLNRLLESLLYVSLAYQDYYAALGNYSRFTRPWFEDKSPKLLAAANPDGMVICWRNVHLRISNVDH